MKTRLTVLLILVLASAARAQTFPAIEFPSKAAAERFSEISKVINKTARSEVVVDALEESIVTIQEQPEFKAAPKPVQEILTLKELWKVKDSVLPPGFAEQRAKDLKRLRTQMIKLLAEAKAKNTFAAHGEMTASELTPEGFEKQFAHKRKLLKSKNSMKGKSPEELDAKTLELLLGMYAAGYATHTAPSLVLELMESEYIPHEMKAVKAFVQHPDANYYGSVTHRVMGGINSVGGPAAAKPELSVR